MMTRYLYPEKRKIEVLSAVYAGGLGIYTGGVWSLWGMTPFYWLTSDQIGLATALDKPLRACAGALAGESMPAARRDCLPVVAIYQAATRE